MTVIGRIFGIAAQRIAVAIGNEEISYGRLQQDINTMSLWLRENGIGARTRLAISLRPGSYWCWIAHLAAIRVGACHVTTNGLKAFQRAVELGLDAHLGAEPREDLPPTVRPLVLRPMGLTPLAEQLGTAARNLSEDEAETHASRIALTSGTTGKPRALLWNHALIEKRVEQVARGAGVSPETRLFAALNLATTGGLRYPLATWWRGGCVLMRGHREETSQAGWKIIQQSNLLITSPPNLHTLMIQFHEQWPGHSERTIIALGGRVPTAQRDRAIRQVGVRLIINYGSTETGSVTAGDSSILDRHPGAVGFARDGATIEIVDERDRPLPVGEAGIVRIKTQDMCHGYEQEEAAQSGTSSFRKGWFYPADQGFLFEDGLLAITGRTSETLNLGGVKISVPDLETELSQIPQVEEVCVVPVNGREMDLLAIVMVFPQNVDPTSLNGVIKPILPGGVTFRIVRVRAIPRNAMGKIRRQDLSQWLFPIFERKQRRRAT